jgi:3D (Asp-Asp-Asp) domain-containing protein
VTSLFPRDSSTSRPEITRLPLIARSLRRKIAATVIAAASFVFLYEVTIRDSRSARETSMHDPTSIPMAGSKLQFAATAYCKGTTTASGVNVRTGIAAADPALLPVGSVISVSTRDPKYNGVYTIMDTGPAVQGRILDLYMWSCHEALSFGRKDADVTVLRLGWNPRASTPSLISTLFRRREKDKAEQGSSGANGSTGAKGSSSDGATGSEGSDVSQPRVTEPLAPIEPEPIAPLAPLAPVEPVSRPVP